MLNTQEKIFSNKISTSGRKKEQLNNNAERKQKDQQGNDLIYHNLQIIWTIKESKSSDALVWIGPKNGPIITQFATTQIDIDVIDVVIDITPILIAIARSIQKYIY